VLSPCERPVPLLGAGISVRCGLPSGAQLAQWMRGLPLTAGVDFGVLPPTGQLNPLWVAQQIVQTDLGLRAPLQQALAGHLAALESAATLTPALRALARTPNRPALILTLNYDRLVEKAAAEIGREVHTLGVKDIPRLLNNDLIEPDGSLRVLHLHGSLSDLPEQLVLDADAYAARANDQFVRDLFGALLAFYNLCIIGSSFEEQYLAAVLQARRPTMSRHVIVCDAPTAERIRGGSAALTAHLHNVLVCDYPENDHRVLDGFCERLVRRAPVLSTRVAAVSIASIEPDPLYQPRRFVDLRQRTEGPDKFSTELPLNRERLAVLGEGDLRAERRAVVVGIPGAGKSRLLERLAVSPDAGERAVLVRLRDVREVVGEPEGLLASWVAVGCVLDDGGPVPIGAVGDGSLRVHLLLDGLDELPRDARQNVAEAIVRVGDALPEQRLTLSSRPSDALGAIPEHWCLLELLCDDHWRSGLLRRADTDEGALAAQLGSLYPVVEPLLCVPFFLRGMLDLLASGRTPRDGLDLALLLLRRLLEEDRQLSAFGAALDRWLERVALTMLLNGSSIVSAAELRGLAGDLDIGDPDLAADLLASRSLLLESSGRYAFQHKLFAEGLVAEFLLAQPPKEWMDVLAPDVAGHSMLRKDWRGVADLLLPRSAAWRAALSVRDPRAGARATPPNAPPAERRRSAQRLWDRAQRLDVWIDFDWSFSGLTDGETVGALIRAGGLDGLEVEVRKVLREGTSAQRSSAVDVIGHARLSDTERLLRGVLVDDPDSSVRTRVASAAANLRLKGLVGPLVRLAVSTNDTLESENLAWVALKLTPASERFDLATRLLMADNHRLDPRFMAEHLTPATQLRWLAIRARRGKEEDRFVGRCLENIVATLSRPTRGQAAQIGLVAAGARMSSSTIVDFLAQHRQGAAGLIDALEEGLVDTREIVDLLLAAGSKTLRRCGAGHSVLEQVESWEQASARPPTPTPTSLVEPLGLREVMAMEDRDRRLKLLLAQSGQLMLEIRDAPDELKRQLIDQLDECWGGRILYEAVDLQGEQAVVHEWAAAVLWYGPGLEWKLGIKRWAQAALCGGPLCGGSLSMEHYWWLRSQAEADGVQLALRLDPQLTSLQDLAEATRPEDLPILVDAILRSEAGQLSERGMTPIVFHLAAAHRSDLLWALAARSPALDRRVKPFLAACGDVPAQLAQLQKCIDCLRAGDFFDGWAYTWLNAAQDVSLFDHLVTAILLVGISRYVNEPMYENVLTDLETAIERIDPLASIALYDELIAARLWPGAQLLVQRRDWIVRRLVDKAGERTAAQAARRLNLLETASAAC
jgi:SIR2-like domain